MPTTTLQDRDPGGALVSFLWNEGLDSKAKADLGTPKRLAEADDRFWASMARMAGLSQPLSKQDVASVVRRIQGRVEMTATKRVCHQCFAVLECEPWPAPAPLYCERCDAAAGGESSGSYVSTVPAAGMVRKSALTLLAVLLLAACVPTEPEPIRSVEGWWSGTVEAPTPAGLTLNLKEASDGTVKGFATLNWLGDDIAYPLEVTGTNAGPALVTLRASWAFGVRSIDWTLELAFEGPDRLIGSAGTWPVVFERLPR